MSIQQIAYKYNKDNIRHNQQTIGTIILTQGIKEEVKNG